MGQGKAVSQRISNKNQFQCLDSMDAIAVIVVVISIAAIFILALTLLLFLF